MDTATVIKSKAIIVSIGTKSLGGNSNMAIGYTKNRWLEKPHAIPIIIDSELFLKK